MLTHLHIRNYALISELDIDFRDGFSVITGETGAGKSIILGALALIRGDRADSKSITEGEQKCVVEAVFKNLDEANLHLKAFFSDNDLDFIDTCIIRRELSVSGKSRAFINDTPVSLGILRVLTDMLIDIHSQHENLLLRDDAFQLQVIDAVAGNEKETITYSTAYISYRETERQLQELQHRAEKMRSDKDYTEFQYQQLEEARIEEGEEARLEQDLQLLQHAEEIKSALLKTEDTLDGNEQSVVLMLRNVLASLRSVEQYLPEENRITDRLDSSYIELRDIAEEAARLAEYTEFDPERLLQTEERLDLLNSLMQKHHCHSTSELIELRDKLEAELRQNESYDEQITELKKQFKTQLQVLEKASKLLTASRQAVTESVSRRLEKQLLRLGIPHARIDVRITQTDDFTPSGSDNVQFYFAANKNQTLRLVAEVASGGEISRLMLCIKALTAERQQLATIIFDEVDTGVSGEVADNMGILMQQLAKGRQIITITHLPQIAVKGSEHYKVYKQDNETRTETHIRLLSDEERICEIATLLSGGSVTKAAIDNARDLLKAH